METEHYIWQMRVAFDFCITLNWSMQSAAMRRQIVKGLFYHDADWYKEIVYQIKNLVETESLLFYSRNIRDAQSVHTERTHTHRNEFASLVLQTKQRSDALFFSLLVRLL